MDTDTLERLTPDHVEVGDVTGRESLDLHLARYEFAAQHVRPGRLLDIACGVGYGTALLVERRSDVTEALGVDRSPDAIAYARARYGNARTSFLVADAMGYEDHQRFDTIVTLETIEHLPDPKGFLRRLVPAQQISSRIQIADLA